MVRTRILAVACATLLSACSPGKRDAAEIADENAAKVALGKRIFFDTNLSSDGRTSCATCHKPELAFTDGLPRSKGVFGREGTRNAPSLIGVAERRHLFWDGRETDIARAALQPFTNSMEMGLASEAQLHQQLQSDSQYVREVHRAFPDSDGRSDADKVGRALVAYLQSLPMPSSAFARYKAGDPDALSADEQRGLALFTGKAQCSACHDLTNHALTDDRFHHSGVNDKAIAGLVGSLIAKLDASPAPQAELVLSHVDIAGLGRFATTRQPQDLATFRTPSLRNVGLTGPYMHDGSVSTLEAAVDQEVYYRGLNQGRPLALTAKERQQLTEFLRAFSE